MKKIISLAILYFITSTISVAATCPPADAVHKWEGGKHIPVVPSGWQFNNKGPNRLDSTNIKFTLAAWGRSHPSPTSEEMHVRCYYYADHSPNHGVSIETIPVIAESDIVSHASWKSKTQYYMCNDVVANSVGACAFG